MKPLLTTIFATLILFSIATPTFADSVIVDSFKEPAVSAEGTISGGFVPCSGVTCDLCKFMIMANTIIKWLFGMAFILFMILAVKAGIKLVIEGNPAALKAAKESFTNAFIGLIIFLCAWLIVDTLLKELLDGGKGEINIEGYGPWTQVRCTTQSQAKEAKAGFYPGDPEFDPTAPPAPKNADGTAIGTTGCSGSTCVRLSIPCKNPNSCAVAADLAPRIERMHAQANVPGTRVTEAIPAGANIHKSSCHVLGKCVDYGRSGGLNAGEINKVITASLANGLRPVYEVKTAAERNRLISEGARGDYIKVISWVTGSHFSIYGY